MPNTGESNPNHEPVNKQSPHASISYLHLRVHYRQASDQGFSTGHAIVTHLARHLSGSGGSSDKETLQKPYMHLWNTLHSDPGGGGGGRGETGNGGKGRGGCSVSQTCTDTHSNKQRITSHVCQGGAQVLTKQEMLAVSSLTQTAKRVPCKH